MRCLAKLVNWKGLAIPLDKACRLENHAKICGSRFDFVRSARARRGKTTCAQERILVAANGAIIDLPEYTSLRNQVLHFLLQQDERRRVDDTVTMTANPN